MWQVVGLFFFVGRGEAALWADRALVRRVTCACVATKSRWRTLIRSIRVATGVLGTEGSCVGSMTMSGRGGGGEDWVLTRLVGQGAPWDGEGGCLPLELESRRGRDGC